MTFEQPQPKADETITVCALCKAWRDCWIAPNGKHLCDECKDAFGLWCCNRCNELAPQVSFIWIGNDHICFDCYTRETARLMVLHARYLTENPDVTVYLTPKGLKQ